MLCSSLALYCHFPIVRELRSKTKFAVNTDIDTWGYANYIYIKDMLPRVSTHNTPKSSLYYLFCHEFDESLLLLKILFRNNARKQKFLQEHKFLLGEMQTTYVLRLCYIVWSNTTPHSLHYITFCVTSLPKLWFVDNLARVNLFWERETKRFCKQYAHFY